jgi:hypothetical protein
LNLILIILCELSLVSQKLENKSFYFKWIGFKGFNIRYLNDLNKQINRYKYDITESFENRIQIYTRNLILNLIEKNDIGINNEKIEEILKLCNLENQNTHIDKIHLILKYVNIINKENQNDNDNNDNNNTNKIFLLNNKNNIIFKINKDFINENLFNNNINNNNKFIDLDLEEYHLFFNEEILNKFNTWENDLNNNIINININNEEQEFSNKSKF